MPIYLWIDRTSNANKKTGFDYLLVEGATSDEQAQEAVSEAFNLDINEVGCQCCGRDFSTTFIFDDALDLEMFLDHDSNPTVGRVVVRQLSQAQGRSFAIISGGRASTRGNGSVWKSNQASI